MDITDSNYLKELFIDEAKPSLDRHSGEGGNSGGGMTVKEFLEIRNGSYLFYGYTGDTCPMVDVSGCTALKYAFYSCKNLITIPQLNTGNALTMYSMFQSCSALESIPMLDTSKVTNMSGMFYGCEKLVSVPELDAQSATDVNSMFRGCTNIVSVSLKNLYSITNTHSMFSGCKNLTSVPPMDTKNVTNMSNMFENCEKLASVPTLDMRNATSTNNTFLYLYAVTTLPLKNVKNPIGISTCTKLEKDSLISIIYELRNTGPSKTLTAGSTHLAKIANTYVKLVGITDEMRAADEFIDEKLPFVVCESTDEGATLITDYVTAKNWTIK